MFPSVEDYAAELGAYVRFAIMLLLFVGHNEIIFKFVRIRGIRSTTLILLEEVTIKIARYGYFLFPTKCSYGRHKSRIHTAPLFHTDGSTSGKKNIFKELGLRIEFGLQRAIRSKGVL